MLKKEIKTKKKGNKKSFILNFKTLTVYLLLILLSLFNLSVYLAKTKKPAVDEVEKNLHREIHYWRNFLSENPTYRNGWLKLAELEVQTGNQQSAKDSLDKASAIDPNSPEVHELREKLGF
ncbi:MAG: tetratricopeptide repeat protein [Candidatus Jordarchaeaceae archaeon]